MPSLEVLEESFANREQFIINDRREFSWHAPYERERAVMDLLKIIFRLEDQVIKLTQQVDYLIDTQK